MKCDDHKSDSPLPIVFCSQSDYWTYSGYCHYGWRIPITVLFVFERNHGNLIIMCVCVHVIVNIIIICVLMRVILMIRILIFVIMTSVLPC